MIRNYDSAMAEFRFVFTAADYDATVAFYTEKMGLPVLRSWDDHGRGTIISVTGEGQIEFFAGDESAETLSGAALAWEVEDIDDHYSRLVAAGVEFIKAPTDQPWGHRNATFSAPQGLTITLFTAI
jgi:catechol 2,3-dioxygenase-like lactoylglutathione lyase family enzyme